MASLEKAKLQEIKADKNQTPEGKPIPVQFNPASLKLKLTNQSEGGRSSGRQQRQNNGQSSTVLSMDLIFDTADDGTAGEPVSVRTRTREVEKFVLPKKPGGEAPPLLRFEWDKLIIIGIVESLDIDFDHFAENGAPLRAKVSLSIKEQDPKYTYLETGKGTKKSQGSKKPGGENGATAPGSGTNEPGSDRSSDRSAAALDDETPAEFLARQGLDPAAWRGLDVDLSAGLSLEAGVEVGFSAELSASIGIGASIGVQASAGLSLEASLGINVAADATGGGKVNGDKAGQALSAAGGVQAAIATVKMQQVDSAAMATQAAFGRSDAAPTGGAARPGGTAARATVAAGSAANRAPQPGQSPNDVGAISSTAPLPSVDARATSYGFGVPLRPLYPTGLSQSTLTLCSQASQSVREDGGPTFARQKTTAPWVALPERSESRAVADTAEAKKRRHPCDYTYHSCDCDGD